MYKATIITPVYNAEKYIAETIESVLSQEYFDLEYIILNDGSTDRTEEIILSLINNLPYYMEHYRNKIKYIKHDNIGEVSTVNKGLAMATGDIISILNADDILRPDAIKIAAETLGQNPDKVLVYPDWQYIDEHTKVLGDVKVPEYDFEYMIRMHYCFPSVGTFFRKEVLLKAGYRDSQFKYVSDFDHWIRMAMYGDFKHIPQTLAAWRMHSNSASVAKSNMAIAEEHLTLVNKIYSLPVSFSMIAQMRPEIEGQMWKVRRQAHVRAYLHAAVTAKKHLGRSLWYMIRAFRFDWPWNVVRTNWEFIALVITAMFLSERNTDRLIVAVRSMGRRTGKW